MRGLPIVRSVAAIALLAAAGAFAGSPQSGIFDLTTTGNDVFWTSDTTVEVSADQYEFDSVVTLVEVNVRWGFLNLGPIDVTDQVPPDQLLNSGVVAGPAPVIIFDDTIVYPAPPEPAGLSANLRTEIDATGFSKASITDVLLGNVTVDLGSPFGVQTVLITRVRVVGQIDITPVFLPTCPADLDGDGAVNASDLASLLGAWGGTGPADLTLDGVVNAADLASMLGAWGPCP